MKSRVKLLLLVLSILATPSGMFAETKCGTATILWDIRCENYCGIDNRDPPGHWWNKNTYKIVHFHNSPSCDYEFLYSVSPCSCSW